MVKADVIIYGATPAGIAAALSAGENAQSVLLIEPTTRIGGLVTNGLSHTDFRTFEGITGTFLKFSQRIERYYAEKYGPDSPQAKGHFRGTHAEPHVNLLIFKQMLAEQKSVKVMLATRLISVKTSGNKIVSARFETKGKNNPQIQAQIWIDATYEGDLFARAGVPYRVGRESKKEYNESLAPETADNKVQGYNFRLIMTKTAKNRVMPTTPKGYRREDFLPLLDLLKKGRFKSVFCYPSGGIYKAHIPTLPNGKYDINDVSRGLVRLSLPQINDAWPEGDSATREKIFGEHIRHNLGMLYFLQNDKAVPERFQKEARQWGWCKDEFIENGHVPVQLYVREGRRMVGQYIFTENDTNHAKDDARAVLHRDAIAMGDYGPNCHGTDHIGSRFGGKHTGEFYKRVPPYQIPYGVLVPRKVENLLVPVACSSSHVGFCALRLEPIWTSLGQASGIAAQLAINQKIAVQNVSSKEVQEKLHAQGAATIYVSDVLPGSKDFAAVQWWGTQGGLHGLAPMPKKSGERGEHLVGQYFKAFPNHAANLDKVLGGALRKRWEELAKSLKLPLSSLTECKTCGDFIRKAYTLSKKE